MSLTEIAVIGSGSKGNCFLITNGSSRVLMDAGVSFPAIQKALNYKLDNVDACFVTHEHKDHSKSVQKLMDAGINCHMTEGTAKALGLKGHRLFTHATEGPVKNDSNFMVRAFGVTHDAADPCGYTLQHKNGDYIAYITDSGIIPETISTNFTHIIVECNYVESLLWASDHIHAERVKSTHLGLNQVVRWLAQCNRATEIIVMHLSEHHADPDEIDARLYCVTPIDAEVRIA